MGVTGAQLMMSQPLFYIFLCSPLPLGLGELQACPFPNVVFPPLSVCLECLLPSLTVPCKMVLARPDEHETCPYHCSLCLFAVVRRSSCGLIACLILAQTSLLVIWSFMTCVVSCSSISFPWLVFFFVALLWGSIIHKHTGRWMWQGSASAVSWN